MRAAANDIVSAEEHEPVLAAQHEIGFYHEKYDQSMYRTSVGFQSVAALRLNNVDRLRKIMLTVSLSFIALAGLILAVPIKRRLQADIVEIEQTNVLANERANELEVLKQELERANLELRDRNLTLRKAYDETTSSNQYLQLASARFEDLFHGVPFPCFSVDQNGTVFEWNEAASNMFGVSGHESIQKSIFGRYFSFDTDLMLKGLIIEAFKGHHLANIEIEANCQGDLKQLLISVFPLRAARQEPTAALIACADITIQKQAEREATKANTKVGAILDSIKDAFVTLDRNLVYRYVNKTAAAWLGLEENEIIGRLLIEVTPDLGGSDFVRKIDSVLRAGRATTFEYLFADQWLEFRVYPSEEGVSVFYNDITERKRAEEIIRVQQEQLEETMRQLSDTSVMLEHQSLELQEANQNLQRLATTDGLTGLLNHRAMQDSLIIAVHKSATWATPVSVALLDVDHFKKFNDAFGHQAGDKVLKSVAELLRNSVRDIDIAARYGGEEFCIIFPDTNEKEAIAVCERVRKTIESAAWEHRQVTISIGVATGSGVQDPQDLIKQADTALYQAKAAGRNCVVPYKPDAARCA
jgi:diguanylate cyclase (GGDEF)-like protein/PAS domain S-box-containing protein